MKSASERRYAAGISLRFDQVQRLERMNLQHGELSAVFRAALDRYLDDLDAGRVTRPSPEVRLAR